MRPRGSDAVADTEPKSLYFQVFLTMSRCSPGTIAGGAAAGSDGTKHWVTAQQIFLPLSLGASVLCGPTEVGLGHAMFRLLECKQGQRAIPEPRLDST